MNSFGLLNWSIVGLYVLVNLALGFVIGKRVHTAEDFYTGQRTTPWWAIGVSVIATYISALSFLGGPAWSYQNGLSVIAIHLNYPIVIFVVVNLFLPFFFNSGVASIYDYMEKRFGPESRSVIAGVFLLSQAVTSAAILYATALVIDFITGSGVLTAIILVSLVALIYTMMGGTVAIIWTDVFQASILFVGAFVIVIALLTNLPVPLGQFLHQLHLQGKTHALNFSLDLTQEATVWSGVFAMSIYHITVYGANQMMVQRTLAAKNIGDAKKSYLTMGFAAFFIYFLFFLLGILLYGYYQGRPFANGNTIILTFAAAQRIPGLMGIITAAIIAASMSTLAASFNSLATTSTVDFYQRHIRKGASPQHYLAASRWLTLVWAVAVIVPAILYASSSGSVLQTLSKLGSYFVGAQLSMYGMGFFSKHTTQKGLLVGVAAGFIAIWFVAAKTPLAWPWYCLVGAAVNMGVARVASHVIDGPQADWSEYSIPGQQRKFKQEGWPEKDAGWYRVPGKIDRASYWLIAFFFFTILLLYAFQSVV